MRRPTFGIGQRAFLVHSPAGNVLWDCLGNFDKAADAAVEGLGGIAAIAFSHPHFYCSMVEWSHAFGGAPIYIPHADASWVQRQSGAIRIWEERTELLPGLTLVQCGGHFAGSRCCTLRREVRSNPNRIPLGAEGATRIARSVRDLAYARMYGAFPGMVIPEDADTALHGGTPHGTCSSSRCVLVVAMVKDSVASCRRRSALRKRDATPSFCCDGGRRVQ